MDTPIADTFRNSLVYFKQVTGAKPAVVRMGRGAYQAFLRELVPIIPHRELGAAVNFGKFKIYDVVVECWDD